MRILKLSLISFIVISLFVVITDFFMENKWVKTTEDFETYHHNLTRKAEDSIEIPRTWDKLHSLIFLVSPTSIFSILSSIVGVYLFENYLCSDQLSYSFRIFIHLNLFISAIFYHSVVIFQFIY